MQGVASLLAHVAPEDRPRVREAFRAALQESVSGRAEFKIIGDDKRERWIDGAWTVTMATAAPQDFSSPRSTSPNSSPGATRSPGPRPRPTGRSRPSPISWRPQATIFGSRCNR